MEQTILLTGGAGYIGTHTCVELQAAGHQVVVVDNYSNSDPVALDRVAEITGRRPVDHRADLRDRRALATVFADHRIDAVVHLAGLKAVGESVDRPLAYFDNNIAGTGRLLEAMTDAGVRRLVFSSSSTVYDPDGTPPFTEDAPLRAVNPYGQTKLVVEQLLASLCGVDPRWRVRILRYFNPVGAHPSGLIGESPHGPPNNLMPYLTQVAVGLRPRVDVFGGDYPTPDGTGIRDYLHVTDLARGHLAALDHLDDGDGYRVYNLGTGRGHSVLDVIAALGAAAGREIGYRVVGRRPGDVAVSYADPSRAWRELGWRAEHGLAAMCRDAWRFQRSNPRGITEPVDAAQPA